jgi:Na+-translocating ferredoxin:NAD+ oxidoreductase RNF subunit RnfB
MKAGLTRRDLFSWLARPFQNEPHRSAREPAGRDAGAPREAVQQVAIIQGRHCLALTSFCAACVERCPVSGAMQVINRMPMVVMDVCTGCGICHEVCPAPTNAVLLRPRRPKFQSTPDVVP